MKIHTISQYAEILNNRGLLEESNLADKEHLPVKYLTYDSREVTEGTLFVCKGANFKEDYLVQALAAGADFYVAEKVYELDGKQAYLKVKDIRKAMAIMANFYDNEPWKEMTVTAVGGTKGKTTTSFFLKGIADAFLTAQGEKQCGLISTIAICDGDKKTPSRRTTPEAVELQHILRRCADNGVKRVCMEVSSQGLKYDRVDGMRFDVSIFLNISEDHISPSEHKDFNDYFTSKMKMFEMSDKTVVNLDSDYIEEVLSYAHNASQVYTFSTKNRDADFLIENVRKEGHDTVFELSCKDFTETFKISIPGFFNTENAAAAIIASYISDIPIQYIRQGIYGANPDGRMELYASDDRQIVCVVDYAHNGFSMEKLFSSVKAEYPDREITAVFGMPGGKAFGRRKEAGETAGKYADKIVLTADDPANEKVEDICEQIAMYIPKTTEYTVIADREEAVKYAITHAAAPAVVVVTGKGSESDQAVGTGYVKCLSDAESVQKYLKIYNG